MRVAASYVHPEVYVCNTNMITYTDVLVHIKLHYTLYSVIIYNDKYIRDSHHAMCHGAGAKDGWIKEYRGLTFTM